MSIKYNEEVYNLIRLLEARIERKFGTPVKLYIREGEAANDVPVVITKYSKDIPELLYYSEVKEGTLLNLISRALRLPKWIFTKKTRDKDVVELRFIAAYILRQYYPDIPLKKVGNLFGDQDHTTIMNQLTRAQGLIDTRDGQFCSKYVRCVLKINNHIKRLSKEL